MNLSSNDEGVYRALTSPLITERTLRTVRTQPKRQQPVEFFLFVTSSPSLFGQAQLLQAIKIMQICCQSAATAVNYTTSEN